MKHTHPFRRDQLIDTRDYVNDLVRAIENYPLSRDGVAAAAVDAVLADLRTRAGFREQFAAVDETTMLAIREHLVGVVAGTIIYDAPELPAAKTETIQSEEIQFDE